MITHSEFKMEVALSQESLAAVQKKEHLWDSVEHSSNIKIDSFFHGKDVKFNCAFYETF